jgi:hypothetical protein
MSLRSRFAPWFKSAPKEEAPRQNDYEGTYEGDCEKMLGEDAAREMNNSMTRDRMVQDLRNATIQSWTTRPPNLYLGEFQESVLKRLDNHCHFCGVLIHSSLQSAQFQYSRVTDLLTVICPICGFAASFGYLEQVSPRFSEMLRELRDAKKERG